MVPERMPEMPMRHDFYDSREVKKTRKEHKCFLCLLFIPKGSTCFFEKGKFDGDVYSRHSHNECASKWKEMNEDDYNGDEWHPFEDMSDVYPHTGLKGWREAIIKNYELVGYL